jgi:hypothetical protein
MIEAHNQWRELAADLPKDDIPMMSESWNNYTDALCKDGELTNLQYQHCPAWDDAMPEDDDAERDYLLDALGVAITSEPAGPRDGWAEGASHWRVTVTRGSAGATFATPYSMGSAWTGKPAREDVLASLVMDAASVWDLVEPGDFEDWADCLGYDSDSRKAEATFNACKVIAKEMADMFSDVSLDDLRELFADY